MFKFKISRLMFLIAIIGLIIDGIFTAISAVIYPEQFCLFEVNRALVEGNYFQIIIYLIIMFYLFYHALFLIQSQLYVTIYSFMLIFLRIIAIGSHPIFWLQCCQSVSIDFQILYTALLGMFAFLIWIILNVLLKWEYENGSKN